MNDVALRKPGEVRVLRAARPVRTMTETTGEHVGLAAIGYNIGQRWMIVWVPDRRDEPITELGAGITGRAVRNADRIAIIDRRLVVGVVFRISPARRRVGCRGRTGGQCRARDG